MAKEMVYFNATKQIETITIHYNSKLDGSFVDGVATSIKDIAKKMSKINLKNPREFDTIQVFVYPSQKLFYKVFAGEIEKRFYNRRRSLEDLYVVQDSEGNIHIVSPRGMSQEKRDSFKRILVMKILGEYMNEKEKQSADRLLKESMKPKEEEQEELEEVEEEVQEEEEPEVEEQEEPEEEELEELEEPEEELDEEELEEIIETELVMEQIDEEQQEETEQVQEESDDEHEEQQSETTEKKQETRTEAQEWLNIGWLAYVRGKLKKEADIKRFAQNISKNGVKKLGQLSGSKLFESYNYSEEYACALVEYIVETYGMEKFTEFYKDPKNIQGVFGVTKFVFNNNVKAFVYRKYTDKQMLMAMDEKGVDEITEIHFAKNGGVDIKTDKDIEAPEIKIKE